MQVQSLNRQKRRSRPDQACTTFEYIEFVDFDDGSGGSTML